MLTVQPTNAALKEWAIVCRALGDGRQTLLVRKGGIQEIKGGFEVTHKNFWLFPTYVHQQASDLVPSVHEEFRALQAAQPPAGTLRFQLYATVEHAVRVTDLETLRTLGDQHILSWPCIQARFQYRNRPGVHVLVLRVHRLPEPASLPSQTWYDGCVSWVDLDQTIPPNGCRPVLSDTEFSARAAAIRARLSDVGIAT